jgi:hypothetical protein
MNKRSGYAFGFNRWHVAGDAFAAGTTVLVVTVLFEGRSVRAVRRRWAVAVKTYLIRRLSQLRIVRGPVNVVARGASHSVPIHHALDKVVALHPILMRRAVREIVERRLSESAVFESPEVL